jgi:hypothetical protein
MTTRNHSTGKREPDPYTKMRRARAALRQGARRAAPRRQREADPQPHKR